MFSVGVGVVLILVLLVLLLVLFLRAPWRTIIRRHPLIGGDVLLGRVVDRKVVLAR
jgi:hypothetical protein